MFSEWLSSAGAHRTLPSSGSSMVLRKVLDGSVLPVVRLERGMVKESQSI